VIGFFAGVGLLSGEVRLYFSDDSFNVMVAPLSIPRPSKTCGQSFEHPGYGELITARGVRFSTPLLHQIGQGPASWRFDFLKKPSFRKAQNASYVSSLLGGEVRSSRQAPAQTRFASTDCLRKFVVGSPVR